LRWGEDVALMVQPLLFDGLSGAYAPAFHNNVHPGNGRRCSSDCQQQPPDGTERWADHAVAARTWGGGYCTALRGAKADELRPAGAMTRRRWSTWRRQSTLRGSGDPPEPCRWVLRWLGAQPHPVAGARQDWGVRLGDQWGCGHARHKGWYYALTALDSLSSVNVTIPIHVASATENHSIQFHQYHLEDMGYPGEW